MKLPDDMLPAKTRLLWRRLTTERSGKPDKVDPGYKSLLSTPPSVPTMAKFFREARDHFEIETSRKRFLGISDVSD